MNLNVLYSFQNLAGRGSQKNKYGRGGKFGVRVSAFRFRTSQRIRRVES